MKKTRKGFTLVELLIVIVVIGVLAAMMMLSSSEAVTSARASTITSNLRNLKTATLALYNDNMDTYDANPGNVPAIGDVAKYLNGKDNDIPDINDYEVKSVETSDYTLSWFIVYRASQLQGTDAEKIREKLKGRAKSLGFVNVPSGKGDLVTYTGGNNDVALQIR